MNLSSERRGDDGVLPQSTWLQIEHGRDSKGTAKWFAPSNRSRRTGFGKRVNRVAVTERRIGGDHGERARVDAIALCRTQMSYVGKPGRH
jgi:hypothetical protein